MQQCEWVFRLRVDVGVECLKKRRVEEAPFKSDKVLKFVKEQGGLQGCVLYLEHLALDCRVQARPIHTELGCLYVEDLNARLARDHTNDGQIDTDTAENDDAITCKRPTFLMYIRVAIRRRLNRFLNESSYYEP